MKTIEITLYNIHEIKNINKEAYEKIMNNTRQYLIDSNFNFADVNIIDYLKDEYNLNIDKNNIYYSISYCQGDGFCFTDENILSYTNIKNKSDLNIFESWIINNLSDDEIAILLDYLNSNYNLNIIRDSFHYCHCYTCIIDYEIFYSSDDADYTEKMNNFIYSLCDRLYKNVYIEICKDIEKMLYGYYEIDDDDIISFIDDNDYHYDINGVLY